MTRLLIKPLVYLLVFGLLGCTSTKWKALEPSASSETIPLVRITLNDGEQIELNDAFFDDEKISGTRQSNHIGHSATTYMVSTDQVRLTEIGDNKTEAGQVVGLVIGIIVVFAGLSLLRYDACFDGDC